MSNITMGFEYVGEEFEKCSDCGEEQQIVGFRKLVIVLRYDDKIKGYKCGWCRGKLTTKKEDKTMGTRSLTVFKEEDGKEICVMYRQYDGYPQGHGKELANFLSGMKMVNGISSADKGKIANGMSCLTAQVIRELKGKDVGGIYIHPLGTRGVWEDYIYIISGKTGEEPEIQILEAHGSEKRRKEKELFSGPATEVKKWIEQLKH